MLYKGWMRSRQIELHWKTKRQLVGLRKEAEREGAYRVARRFHAVILNAEGKSSGVIASLLDSPRSKVSQWLQDYELHGAEGLLEGHRSGRPSSLSKQDRIHLEDKRQGVILIQDNASYHKEASVWEWFAQKRHWLEVYQLPSYCPEFNPTERLWQHTRKHGTHSRFFLNLQELNQTLTRVFTEIQQHPQIIKNYLQPFC
jgi:transposase